MNVEAESTDHFKRLQQCMIFEFGMTFCTVIPFAALPKGISLNERSKPLWGRTTRSSNRDLCIQNVFTSEQDQAITYDDAATPCKRIYHIVDAKL